MGSGVLLVVGLKQAQLELQASAADQRGYQEKGGPTCQQLSVAIPDTCHIV